MVCDSGLHRSEPCLGADGVPGATAGSAVSGLGQALIESRPRCPHCQAWMTKDGQCHNPRCPGNSKPVVDMAEHLLLARCSADTLGDATVGDVEGAAYQMAYEGFLVGPDHNPYPEDDERHLAFNQGSLRGTRDLESDLQETHTSEVSSGEPIPVEQEKELLGKTLETLAAEYGGRGRVTLGQFVEATETAKRELGMTQGAKEESHDRWLDFQVVSGVRASSRLTPDSVWNSIKPPWAVDGETRTRMERLNDLAQELKAASPDDVVHPTETNYAPIPLEAKELGILGPYLDRIGPMANVDEARKVQAKLQTAITQTKNGRWDAVIGELEGAQFTNGHGERMEVVGVVHWPPSLDVQPLTDGGGIQTYDVSDVVSNLREPSSLSVSFSTGGRSRWGEGRISVGPAEPAEPFEDTVELIDKYERVGYGSGREYYPARTYEVQAIVPAEDAVSFDGLARLAEDRLRDAEAGVVKQGEIEPMDLNVERRPDGTLWVTAVFDVVGGEPIY